MIGSLLISNRKSSLSQSLIKEPYLFYLCHSFQVYYELYYEHYYEIRYPLHTSTLKFTMNFVFTFSALAEYRPHFLGPETFRSDISLTPLSVSTYLPVFGAPINFMIP